MKNLLTLCLLAFSITTQAQYTLTVNDVIFVNGEIQKYINTTQKDIIIPDNFDNIAITSIRQSAFYEDELTSVIIPNSVTYIGYSAFQGNNLSTVTIPNSITVISGMAFYGNQLTAVTIPNSVISIGWAAFRKNELTSVTIPNSVTIIEAYSFAENQLTSVIIPNAITSIFNYAFWSNQLTSVTIPNSVKTIGNGAFNDNKLTEFRLPDYYQNDIYSWTGTPWGGESVIYSSGDMVFDLEAYYTIVDEIGTGIRISDKNTFRFYPNPSTDFIHSDLEISTLIISNSQGIVVAEFQSKANQYNVSDLESGVYFIEAKGVDGIIYTSKLIKE